PAAASNTMRARFTSRCAVVGARHRASSTLRSFGLSRTPLALGIIQSLNHDSSGKQSGYYVPSIAAYQRNSPGLEFNELDVKRLTQAVYGVSHSLQCKSAPCFWRLSGRLANGSNRSQRHPEWIPDLS